MTEENYLTMGIEYRVSDNSFEIKGNVNRIGQAGIIGAFLVGQMGSGKDERVAIQSDVYHIIANRMA